MAKTTKHNKKDIFGEKPMLSKADIFGAADVDLPEQDAPNLTLDLIEAGLNIQQLAVIFRVSHSRARALMALCPALKARGGGSLYSIADAAPFLSVPKMTIEEYIKITKVKDLPPLLKAEIWTSYGKMMDVLERTQGLWLNEDVVDALSGMFKLFKEEFQGLPDKMHRLGQLTEEQKPAFTAALDTLRDAMYHNVAKHLKEHAPPIYTARFEEEHGVDFEELVDAIEK